MNIISIYNLIKFNMFILRWKIDKIGKLCFYIIGFRIEVKFKNLKVMYNGKKFKTSRFFF